MNKQQTTGPQGGATGSVGSLRAKEREEWKRRQSLQPSAGVLLAPTLPERISRLSPSERHQISSMIRSMKLRKIIKRTLAEAFWDREADEIAAAQTSDTATMQRLRATVRSHESTKSYESALTTFEPVMTQSQQPSILEVRR